MNDAKDIINEAFVKALELFPFNAIIQPLWDWSTQCNIFVWRSIAVTQSSVTGGILMAVPGVNLAVGVGADITSLFYGMQATAYGVGAIIAKKNGKTIHSLSRDDYIDILAVWAGAPEFIGDSYVKAVLFYNIKSTSKIAIKGVAKTTTYVTAGTISKKMGVPIATPLLEKVITKISAKLGIKASTFVPVAGSFLNAGINGWFINSITNAAKTYYIAKYEGRNVSE